MLLEYIFTLVCPLIYGCISNYVIYDIRHMPTEGCDRDPGGTQDVASVQSLKISPKKNSLNTF